MGQPVESEKTPEEVRQELKDDKLYALFGGGVGSFGRNFSIFTYRGQTVWIDIGCGFPNQNYPGLSRTIPSFEVMKNFPPNVVILTHAHEDHIGAVPYAVEFIPPETPVFASPFTIALVKKKLRETGIRENSLNLIPVEQNGVFHHDTFELGAYFVPHSIPQTFAVGMNIYASENKLHKKIFFTSDYKLHGEEKNFASEDIQKFGPADYLFTDSTGALMAGTSIDETEVRQNLEKVISSWEGRIIVTTFSSQIARIKSIYEIAQKLNRPIGIRGHSIRVHLQAAHETGEFPVPAWKIASPDPEHPKAIWLVAGCQAEEGSSFQRFSSSGLGKMSPHKGDLVIYSGSVIPGNTEQVLGALNHLALQGIAIYGMESGQLPVHTSGHARQDELARMVEWVRPSVVAPVHGDPMHFQAFTSFLGKFPDLTFSMISDRFVYELAKQPKPVLPIDTDPVFIDANEIHHEKKLYCHRRNLATSGICNIIVAEGDGRVELLQYVGTCSDDFLAEKMPLLETDIQKIFNRVYEKGKAKENKVKQKISKVNLKHLEKAPFVNLIYI